MANQNQNSDERKGGKGLLIAGVVVIAGLAAAVGVMGYTLLNRSEPEPEEEATRRSMLATEDNVNAVKEELAKPTPANVPDSFTASMNSTWTFPDGQTSGDAYIENDSSNETPLYFDVSLTETGETLYESPVIPLGGAMRGLTLNRKLDAGSYPGDLVYYLIDDEQNVLTTVVMGVTLVVGGS